MLYLSDSATAGMSTSGGIEFVAQGISGSNGSSAPLCLTQRKKGYTQAGVFEINKKII